MSDALTVPLTPVQKVAALLISLGAESASEVLKSIDDEQTVELLAMEIASLQNLNQDTMSSVFEEFYALFQASGYIASGGVNFARNILEKAYGDERADEILERLVASMTAQPFDFFNKADPAQLAASFQNENPQMVALVLSYLSAEQSAAILSALNTNLQIEVASRVANMDRTNPDILREVERILENKFSSVVSTDYTKAGGVEALAEILNRSDRATERAILDEMEMTDPDNAQRVRELMFVFEDIVTLDDRAIQRVLREVETKDLALALKGSPKMLQDKIFRNMSERAAAMLQEDMEYMGAVRSKDVQEKQTYIVSAVRALEAAGEIVISRGDEEDDFIE
ncbi:MAG: flagellar motor switch protein FliG [Cyanobacteria bacterium HKST-UBA06]|nr:flagellar motor switch protein FliG [Cyanobacteria bacterium HKST-UBA05]MCA9799372.1 flagellar motor switch protein FliG [Cyanobacteria bacterium HKST-UBA04]MCA9806519.1 flagellar motor switch protein FliG [Cyanobacteria bacterium HKST-UBA06]MCA9842121.1 flagellar motor switch protein FliG [Cyanobacteria bacterium HKST-UBA03]